MCLIIEVLEQPSVSYIIKINANYMSRGVKTAAPDVQRPAAESTDLNHCFCLPVTNSAHNLFSWVAGMVVNKEC